MQKKTSKRSFANETYDPFQNPPSIEKALMHQKASKLGKIDPKVSNQVCQCCGRLTVKSQFDIRCKQKQLYFLGSGICLYFSLAKYSLYFLVFLLVVSFIGYSALKDIKMQTFDPFDLKKAYFFDEASSFQQLIFHFVNITLLFIAIIIFKQNYENQYIQILQQNWGPEKFSVAIKGFPLQTEQDAIKNWCFLNFNKKSIQINYCYNIAQLLEAFSAREQLTIALHKNRIKTNRLFQIKNTIKSLSSSSPLLDKGQYDILLEIEKQDKIINKYRECIGIKKYQKVNFLIVTFQNSQTASEIISNYRKTFFNQIFSSLSQTNQLKFEQNLIQVFQAPSPRDIIWENLPGKNNLECTIIVLFLIFVLMAFTFCLFLSITKCRTVLSGQSNKLELMLFILIILYLIYHVIVHYTITWTINKIKPITATSRQKMYVLIYSCVHIYATFNFPYWCCEANIQSFLYILNLMLLANSFKYPCAQLLQIQSLFQNIKIKDILRLDPNHNPYTQDFVKRLLEGKQFQIGNYYQHTIKALYVSIYFIGPSPFSFIFFIISTIFHYLLAKYFLFRLCKQPPTYSKEIADLFMKSLSILPIIYVLGIFKFSVAIHLEINTVHMYLIFVSSILLSLFLIYYPFQKPKPYCRKEFRQTRSYQQNSYEFINPINKYNGELELKPKIYSRNLLELPDLLEVKKISQINSRQTEIKKQKKINKMLSLSMELQDLSNSIEYNITFNQLKKYAN